MVSNYILTDQSYVSRHVEVNLEENWRTSRPTARSSTAKRKGRPVVVKSSEGNVRFMPLDWETDEVTPEFSGTGGPRSFDAVIACDCIYNEALIKPLVQTCVAACKLRRAEEDGDKPALCVVAQQLRDPEIFEGWMKEFHRHFKTWQVPEDVLSGGLRDNRGFVIHVGVLREETES